MMPQVQDVLPVAQLQNKNQDRILAVNPPDAPSGQRENTAALLDQDAVAAGGDSAAEAHTIVQND